MKKAIFIFSSPLQYMFSSFIAKELQKEYVIEGYSFFFQKDFSEVYNQTKQYIDSPIQYVYDAANINYNNIQKEDIILFANRFNDTEIDIFFKAKRKTKNLYLYEEGFSIYLKSHPTVPSYNDGNLRRRIENKLRHLSGGHPRFIRLSNFKKVYSVLKPEHLKDSSKWNKITLESEASSYISDSCLFLLQPLVEDNIADKKKYFDYLVETLNNLEKKYDIIYIKPHPRNNKNLADNLVSCSSKVRLLDDEFKDLPAEIYLTKYKMDVFSFFSSTLVYASELLNIKPYQCLEALASFSQQASIQKYLDTINPLIKKTHIQDIRTLIKTDCQ